MTTSQETCLILFDYLRSGYAVKMKAVLAELHHIQKSMNCACWSRMQSLFLWGEPEMTKTTSLSLALIVATTSNAFAHHPLGGAAPETMLHGFLSGVGHPLIGFDHLAFVVAIGVLAAFQTRRLVMPLGFVMGTMIGSLLTLAAVTLPLTELMITLSVLFAGLVVMRGRDVAVLPATILGSLAGLFHGSAYGAAVIGAETTPILAYLAGFGLIQFGIMLVAGFAIRQIWNVASMAELQPRLAGALLAGVGVTYLVEHAERFLFPAM